MEKTKNLRVSEQCWRDVKLAAVMEGVTMREWVERALIRWAQGNRIGPVVLGPPGATRIVTPPVVLRPATTDEKHWTPDD